MDLWFPVLFNRFYIVVSDCGGFDYIIAGLVFFLDEEKGLFQFFKGPNALGI